MSSIERIVQSMSEMLSLFSKADKPLPLAQPAAADTPAGRPFHRPTAIITAQRHGVGVGATVYTIYDLAKYGRIREAQVVDFDWAGYMICIDHGVGEVTKEPLHHLGAYIFSRREEAVGHASTWVETRKQELTRELLFLQGMEF